MISRSDDQRLSPLLAPPGQPVRLCGSSVCRHGGGGGWWVRSTSVL